MTEQEKFIYNTYIAVTRSKQNKPFKLRKDFAKFEEQKCYPYLKRLVTFFNKYPHIKPQDFFTAPYDIHSDTTHVGIDFYISRAAIKVYSLYQKKLQDISPENQIESVRSSLQYIGSFCIRNKLKLHEYLEHKTGCIYTWMMHYREHHVNIYSLFEMGDILSCLKNTEKDEKALFVDDLQQTIVKFKVRYHSSETIKRFVREGTDRLKKFLN